MDFWIRKNGGTYKIKKKHFKKHVRQKGEISAFTDIISFMLRHKIFVTMMRRKNVKMTENLASLRIQFFKSKIVRFFWDDCDFYIIKKKSGPNQSTKKLFCNNEGR